MVLPFNAKELTASAVIKELVEPESSKACVLYALLIIIIIIIIVYSPISNV